MAAGAASRGTCTPCVAAGTEKRWREALVAGGAEELISGGGCWRCARAGIRSCSVCCVGRSSFPGMCRSRVDGRRLAGRCGRFEKLERWKVWRSFAEDRRSKTSGLVKGITRCSGLSGFGSSWEQRFGAIGPIQENREAAVLSGAEESDRRMEHSWTTVDSETLYRVHGWGSPYFYVNLQGRVCVRLSGLSDGSDEVDLVELIESMKKRNVQLPVVIRFPDIIHHRIQELHDSFSAAIAFYKYQRPFQGVFPIKCNHDGFLVEEIVKFGRPYGFGLEAGSKPELLIAIAKLRKSRNALLICNGYKDKVYIESVLLARQLGVNAVIVLEQMEELELVIGCSKTLGVRPMIGVRVKLSTKHSGHWGKTSGDNGKFGLTVNEIIRVVYTLRHENMLDCLQLLHFHIGSQIPSISIIKEAMREASHTYCELALMGAAMGYVDVGGGLGIDYDGTKRESSASTNYTMQNYANDVVAALVDACILKGVAQPIIISESGRALASHHSVLVFDVLSTSQRSEKAVLDDLATLNQLATSKLGSSTKGNVSVETSHDSHKGQYLLSTFHEVYRTVNETNYWEALNDAKQFKLEAGSLFKLGCLTLEQRAQANALYEAVCHRVFSYAQSSELQHELQNLCLSMAAVYHVNMSVFRSAPDSWAINQIFPIIPLQRLNEKPTIQATLADLTCDCDGKIDRFVGANGEIMSALPVHPLKKDESYYIGLFLGGVYQEAMGSAHNLFGATHTVHVRTKPKSGSHYYSHNKSVCAFNGGPYNENFSVEHIIMGQTIAEVLSTVQHDAKDLIEDIRKEAEEAIADGRLTSEDAQILLRNYECSLDSYTYLTK